MGKKAIATSDSDGLLDDGQIQELGAELRHAIPSGRAVFTTIIRGQPPSRPDLDVMAAFKAYQRYLVRLQKDMVLDEFEPDQILDEHVMSVNHVVDCLARLLRGESIPLGDAYKANNWLRNVLDGDFLFTCETHEP